MINQPSTLCLPHMLHKGKTIHKIKHSENTSSAAVNLGKVTKTGEGQVPSWILQSAPESWRPLTPSQSTTGTTTAFSLHNMVLWIGDTLSQTSVCRVCQQCGRHRVDGWLIIADVYSSSSVPQLNFFWQACFCNDGTLSLKLIVVIISHGFGLLLYCTKKILQSLNCLLMVLKSTY